MVHSSGLWDIELPGSRFSESPQVPVSAKSVQANTLRVPVSGGVQMDTPSTVGVSTEAVQSDLLRYTPVSAESSQANKPECPVSAGGVLADTPGL